MGSGRALMHSRGDRSGRGSVRHRRSLGRANLADAVEMRTMYGRGRSWPISPSENAIYSRPNCVTGAISAFGITPEAARDNMPGVDSL
jgi:hypothetical protein